MWTLAKPAILGACASPCSGTSTSLSPKAVAQAAAVPRNPGNGQALPRSTRRDEAKPRGGARHPQPTAGVSHPVVFSAPPIPTVWRAELVKGSSDLRSPYRHHPSAQVTQ